MEIAGKSTYLVENLLDEVVDLFLRLIDITDDRLDQGEI